MWDFEGYDLSKIPHSVFIRLQAVYGSLKQAERKAADLLLRDTSFISEATIVEASSRAGCSEATFTRFARKLGFQGYPELRQAVFENQPDLERLPYTTVSENDSCRDIAEKVFKASAQALNDTLQALNFESFEAATHALQGAERLLFCGSGDAYAVAYSGYQRFIRLGIPVIVTPDPDVQLITASNMQKGDVMVAVSHSGRTRSLVETAKMARASGLTVISITNYPKSPLTKQSDIVLLTAAFTEHTQGEIMAKRITELCIMESLFTSMLLLRRSELMPRLKRANNAVEINKLK